MTVIDFCLTRTLVCDEDTNYQSLRLSWASKTSCEQRKGKVFVFQHRPGAGRHTGGPFKVFALCMFSLNQRLPLLEPVLRIKQQHLTASDSVSMPDPPLH